LESAGKSSAASMAMMAMTTSNSIRVNPDRGLSAPPVRPMDWQPFFISDFMIGFPIIYTSARAIRYKDKALILK
jgi:hypothetical protein